MDKKRKVLLTTLAASGLLMGCEKTDNYNDTDIKEEIVVLEDNNDKENSSNTEIKEEVSESKNESSNKESESKDKETTNKTEVSTNKKPSSVENTNNNTVTDINKNDTVQEPKFEDTVVLVDNPTFTKSDITEDLKVRMMGKSMKENNSISFDDLSYIQVSYVDYDGNTQIGEMVVHKKLADELLDIFRDIYYAKFPIQRMNLIDDYNADDHTSMVNNNSSAFCYRTIAGTDKVSNHGLGMAVDINPFYNPHVLKKSNTVNPPEAAKYANRSLTEKGMIKKGDAVYNAFVSRGWKWGGNWNNPDYQHFEKKI